MMDKDNSSSETHATTEYSVLHRSTINVMEESDFAVPSTSFTPRDDMNRPTDKCTLSIVSGPGFPDAQEEISPGILSPKSPGTYIFNYY